MGGRVGDLLVLVGIVVLFIWARKKGKANRASAISNAHAAGYGEGFASASATASSNVAVTVGQQSAAGIGTDDARLAEIFRYVLGELGYTTAGLRPLRNGADVAGIGLGDLPAVLQPGSQPVRSFPGVVAAGLGVVREINVSHPPKELTVNDL